MIKGRKHAPDPETDAGTPQQEPAPGMALPEQDDGADFSGPVGEQPLLGRGGRNFRDMGMLPAAPEQQVAPGLLFRSDALNNVDTAFLSKLTQCSVRTVVDFRTDREAAAAPDRIPASVRNVARCPIAPGRLGPELLRKAGDAAAMEHLMRRVYREMAVSTKAATMFARFFRLVTDPANLPLVFHCSAGKDRTGAAAALVLLGLGASRETVMKDYLASNACLAGKYAALLRASPQWTPLFTVREAYLEEFLDSVNDWYGSPEEYLEDVLEVDLERLRALLLVPDH